MKRLEQFLGNLPGRSVWQILLVYLGGSWAVLEVADHLVERFGMPEWAYGSAVLFLLLGIPFFLAIAVVPRGGKDGPPADRDESVERKTTRKPAPRRRGITWRHAALGGLIAVAGWGGVATVLLANAPTLPEVETQLNTASGDSGALAPKAIAVLPFLDLGGRDGMAELDNEYFADGIHGDILTHLGQVGDLRVMARTAVNEYRGADRSIPEIGRALSVGSVVEGTVRRVGDRVRISAQLIDASNQEQLWAGSYDRDLSAVDLFDVQSDIATRIAEALTASLTKAERRRLERQPTESFTAWGFFSKAQAAYGKYSADDNEEAIRQVRRALELDTTYAEAGALLADAYSQRSVQHGFPISWVDSAEAAARTALHLAPDLPTAHKALALTYAARGWTRRSIDANARALELNPGHFGAMNNLAMELMFLGRYGEALPWLRKAVSLAPTAVFLKPNLGFAYWILGDGAEARRWWEVDRGADTSDPWLLINHAFLDLERSDFEAAIEKRTRAMRVIPDEPVLRLNLGLTYLYARQYEAAVTELTRSIQLAASGPLVHAHDPHYARSALGRALVGVGREEQGRAMLERSLDERLAELSRGADSPRTLWEISALYSSLGKVEEAIDYANRAFTDGFHAFNRWEDPLFDNVRADRRFIRLRTLMRVGLQEQRAKAQGNVLP